MNNTTTRIADLPDNITIQSIDEKQDKMNNISNLSTLKSQLIVPSTNNTNSSGLTPSQENTLQQMQQHYENQQALMLQHYEKQIQQLQQSIQQQHRLPSRDIPRNTLDYMQDEEIKANYIPDETTEDYVKKKQILDEEKKIRQHNQKKKNNSFITNLWNELQTPIFIILLFFLFQLPYINTVIFKKFSFLSITNDDGNFNTNGVIFKSILFGSLYYLLVKVMKYVTEF